VNNHDFEKIALNALRQVAPDIDPADVNRSRDLREQFDIDSMDFLNIVTRLSTELSIAIPESDYPKIASVDALIAYLQSSVSSS
jgi:acyl carrier protein